MTVLKLFSVMACVGALTTTSVAGEKSVKIGVLTDLTSFASTAMGPGSVIASQLAAEHFGGKVLGKPIEVISADMQSKPDLAVQIARRWYEADNVDLIVDVPASAAAIAIQAMATEKDKMFMATVAATPVLTLKGCSPNAVHWVNNTSSLGTLARKRADGRRRQDLVPHHAGFSARQGPGCGGHAADRAARRQSARRDLFPNWQWRLLAISPARAGLGRGRYRFRRGRASTCPT